MLQAKEEDYQVPPPYASENRKMEQEGQWKFSIGEDELNLGDSMVEEYNLVDLILVDPRPYHERGVFYVSQMVEAIKEIRKSCYEGDVNGLLGLRNFSSENWVFLHTTIKFIDELLARYTIESIVLTKKLGTTMEIYLNDFILYYHPSKRPRAKDMTPKAIKSYDKYRNQLICNFGHFHNLFYALYINPDIYL